MSDGPYKSLPMRPKWKALSRRADNAAFAPEQVSEAVRPALAADWADVSTALLGQLRIVLTDDRAALLPDHTLRGVEALRSSVTMPIEAALIDAACDALSEGRSGQEALEQAVTDTLLERGLRGIRQVEEHWLREATDKRSKEVRRRLEAAIIGADLPELARSLLGGVSSSKLRPVKRDALDDGVGL